MPFPELQEIQKIVASPMTRNKKLSAICLALNRTVSYFNWVGFYIADDAKRELVLGPFIGTPTEHIRIPFGKGICGRAADELETVIVQDVTGEENYLSCGIDVRSEIIVPVFKNGRFVAELDIDSHVPSPFKAKDRAFLEEVCRIASLLF
ncbi:MAG: GAF domain-containing protein [Candidatus Neomarinimicrobiota bacterium]